jgi:serine/threonine protein kinase
LTGEYDLTKLSDEKWSTSKALIEKMISVEHTHRPTTLAILKHPMFWPTDKTLNFLQDVSDRVDKESFDSAILASIERNRLDIVRNNWYDYLDVQVNSFLTLISFYKSLIYVHRGPGAHLMDPIKTILKS